MSAGAGSGDFSYAEPPWYCGSTNPLSHKGKVKASLQLDAAISTGFCFKTACTRSFQADNSGAAALKILTACVQGFLCPADSGQVCKADLRDPQYGYQGFDNFAQNLLLVFQVCMLECAMSLCNVFENSHHDSVTTSSAPMHLVGTSSQASSNTAGVDQ